MDVLTDHYDFIAVYLHEVAGRELGEQWRAYDREYAALVEQVVREAIDDGTIPPTVTPA